MSFERQHDDLNVVLTRSRNTGEILKADLVQPEDAVQEWEARVQLTKAQLYALVDDVAVADPEEWSRRFPPEDAAELALRRVADYCRARAKANRAIGNVRGLTLGDGFDLAATRALEEIEALYGPGVLDPTTAVNDNLNRRG
jgi:hypothetical protein